MSQSFCRIYKILINGMLFIILSFSFISCKTNSKLNTFSKNKGQNLTEKEQTALTTTFFEANKEKILGNKLIAEGIFLKCLKIDSHNDASMFELASLYYERKSYKDALDYINEAISINKNNTWYKILKATILQETKQFKDAAEIYKEITELEPNRIEYKDELANNLVLAEKCTEAIKIYNDIEKNYGFNEEIVFKKIQLYQKAKEFDAAINEVETLINLFPTELKYYGMLSELYMNSKKEDKAFETYNKMLQIDSNYAYVHLSLADYYRSKGDEGKFFNEIKLAFKSADLDIDTKVKILLSYYTISENNNKLKTQAFELLDILMKVHPDEPKAHSIYSDFLYRDKQLEKARDELKILTNTTKDKFVIWHQLLIIESELSDYESIVTDSKKALELFPAQPILYLFNGMANYFLKNYEDAINILQKGKDFVFNDNEMLAEFYSYIGDANHESKKNKESFEAYEKVLALTPNNPYVLNNYSYYLSLTGDSLEKAAKMALKANELSPNEDSFQDTYGWILYKLQKFEEAKKWIQKAMENGGTNSGVILEHYGDILFKLNKKDEAFYYWEKAKIKGNGSEFLDEKISKKQLIE